MLFGQCFIIFQDQMRASFVHGILTVAHGRTRYWTSRCRLYQPSRRIHLVSIVTTGVAVIMDGGTTAVTAFTTVSTIPATVDVKYSPSVAAVMRDAWPQGVIRVSSRIGDSHHDDFLGCKLSGDGILGDVNRQARVLTIKAYLKLLAERKNISSAQSNFYTALHPSLA